MSVVIIAYNNAPYLGRCLSSVQCQTLADFEVFVVDNGSTDDIDAAVAPFLDDERFSLIRLQKECGPGGARNAGLDAAQGEYVTFIDGDDWIDATYLEDLAAGLDKTGAEVANAAQIVMYDSPYRKSKVKAHYGHLVELQGEFALRLASGEIDNGIPMLMSSLGKMFRRDFLTVNDLRFIPDMFYEDQLHTYRCYLVAKKVVCIPGGAYRYYKRTGSITQSFSRKHVDDMVRIYALIREELERHGVLPALLATYYRSLEHCLNLIIRQIFEYERCEEERKDSIRYALVAFLDLIDLDEYIEVNSSETIRQHLQPGLESTAIN